MTMVLSTDMFCILLVYVFFLMDDLYRMLWKQIYSPSPTFLVAEVLAMIYLTNVIALADSIHPRDLWC